MYFEVELFCDTNHFRRHFEVGVFLMFKCNLKLICFEQLDYYDV